MSDVKPLVIPISEARKLLYKVEKVMARDGIKVILVKRHHKTVFAIVCMDHLDALQQTLEILSDPEAMKNLASAIEDVKAGRLHDHKEMEEIYGGAA